MRIRIEGELTDIIYFTTEPRLKEREKKSEKKEKEREKDRER